MKNFLVNILFVILLLTSFSANAQKAEKSFNGPNDKRFKTFIYKPDTVFEYTGYYGVPSRIDLDPTEKILTIAMADTTSWKIEPVGFRLFLKPVKFDAQTYMSIITTKRIYYFELYSAEATGIKDPNLVFAAKFIYPEGNVDIPSSEDAEVMQFDDIDNKNDDEHKEVPDPIKQAGMLNFNYSVTGSKVISPLEVFDDGEFTYFRFKGIGGEVPAIFQVMPDGNEALINFRVKEGYTIIEMVTSQFTLRYGNLVACVFNETMPLEQVVPMKEVRDNKKFLGIF